MQKHDPGGERQIKIHTVYGIIDGTLRIAEQSRTLDELNGGSEDFLTVQKPELTTATWSFDEHQLTINKASILFVQEMTPPAAVSRQAAQGQFTRASVRLRVDQFDVVGFMHVITGGSPMKRLGQDNHTFIPLTSVSVVGSDQQFATPFLVVNRRKILAAQEVGHAKQEAEA